MNRSIIITMALAIALGFCPLVNAGSSKSGGGVSDGGVHGQIQSVTTSNFSVGTHTGHGRHHRSRLKPIVVHYNPQTISMTVDGVSVTTLDVAATGKYVSVFGTMKNNVLEATSITVSSSPPSHLGKSKSARK